MNKGWENNLYIEDGGGIDFIHLKQDNKGNTMLEIGHSCRIVYRKYGTVHEITADLSEKFWKLEDN